MWIMPVLVLLLFVVGPLLIARLANLAGRYRLTVMVVLLLLGWLGIASLLLSNSSDGPSIPGAAAAIPAIITILVVPLVFVGRLLARVIARRYAPAVADAIASVIVGSIASFMTFTVSASFVLPTLAQNSSALTAPDTAQPLSLMQALSLLGVAVFIHVAPAWVLMAWGSMPTLRQRKATVLGVVCAAIAILFALISSLLVVYARQVSSPDIARAALFMFLGGGAISMLMGMLTAGFMHGILVGLASLFDFAAFVFMVLLLMTLFGFSSPMSGSSASVDTGISLRLLVLIVALSIVQLRAVMIGHRVVTTFSLSLLLIPFVAVFLHTRPDGLRIAAFAVLFVLLVAWLGRWGVALRHLPYGGQISNALLAAALIAVPAVFLIL